MPTLPKASSAITLINLDQLTEHDQEALVSEGLIDAEVFDYAKDKNETSFMEENKEKLTIVFQILDRQEESYHPNHIPRVIPITLFLNDQSLYILGHDHSLTLIEEVFPDLDESRSPRHLVF
ncbi:magnesium and cobalt transport protein [Streptococcus pyogenes]|nr:magnesium and cobalt transport protein [Streptococcus pyogenes]VGV51227.1 Zinc transport protein zntB [Streptococcus pyogenes]